MASPDRTTGDPTLRLTLGELCAGYGGLGLGIAQVLNCEPAWVADVCKVTKHKDGTYEVGHHEPCRSPCTILEHHWPGVPNLGDITKVDWTTVPRVDVLAGGTPCQDLSNAGRRAGMAEGTRSNLWVAMREAIAILRPSLVVWENVGGAYSANADSDLGSDEGLLDGTRVRPGEPVLRALGRVLGDLATLRYDAGWYGIRAADVGAPHNRLRVFVAAVPADADGEGRRELGRILEGARHSDGRRGQDLVRAAAESASHLIPTPRAQAREKAWAREDYRANLEEWAGHWEAGSLDTAGRGSAPQEASLFGTPAARDAKGEGSPARWPKAAEKGHVEAQVLLLPTPTAVTRDRTDEEVAHRQATRTNGPNLDEVVNLFPTPAVNDMGEAYTPETWDAWTERMRAAHQNGNGHGPSLNVEVQRLPTPNAIDAEHPGVVTVKPGQQTRLSAEVQPERWGKYAAAVAIWEALTRPAPTPTTTSSKGNPQLAPEFPEWMMGLPAGWVTAVPGMTRREALKALGNGVVPQQAAAALSLLLDLM